MAIKSIKEIGARHPKLRGGLNALARYIVRKRGEGQGELEPSLAARELRTTEANATALLMLLEQARLLRHVYNIYCGKQRALLASVEHKRQIPAALYCKFCEKEHQRPDEFEVELAFQVVDSAWERSKGYVAAP